ncbi:unnamed protein product [Chrysoparadoxa australica]
MSRILAVGLLLLVFCYTSSSSYADLLTVDDYNDLNHAGKRRPPLRSISAEIFAGLDGNADGVWGEQEMKEFVKSVGGVGLDEREEIDGGVAQIMNHLDVDEDHAITVKDLQQTFSTLGSVLTVDEAADWVVNAVQLPPQVGESFRQNMVNGYDFPDLIKDDGAAIVYDLGITRRAFRKSIVKAIEVRLLGLGRVPLEAKLEAQSLGSNVVHISWLQPSAWSIRSIELGASQTEPELFDPFPVHTYILQRRPSKNVEGDVAQDDGEGWVTIYKGKGSFFLDHEVSDLNASILQYRLQSWNLIGHGKYAYASVAAPRARPGIGWWSHLKGQGQGGGYVSRAWNALQGILKGLKWLWWIASTVLGVLNGILLVAGMLANLLRLRAAWGNGTGDASVSVALPSLV